jgi:hypothetical protein
MDKRVVGFVAAGALALAWLVTHFEGSDGLTKYVIAATAIALLTLIVTQRIILWAAHKALTALATVCHFVGRVLDKVAGWAYTHRQQLARPRTVPEWDEVRGDDGIEDIGLDIIRD